jgi:hypothetical protein
MRTKSVIWDMIPYSAVLWEVTNVLKEPIVSRLRGGVTQRARIQTIMDNIVISRSIYKQVNVSNREFLYPMQLIISTSK